MVVGPEQGYRRGAVARLAHRRCVEGRNAQALELYVRLELVRGEVEAMRGRNVRNLHHPPSSAIPSTDLLDTLGKLAAAGERLEE
jgi:hypothetical protein